MVTVKTISFRQTRNLTNYESRDISMSAEVTPEENPQQVIAYLKKEVLTALYYDAAPSTLNKLLNPEEKLDPKPKVAEGPMIIEEPKSPPLGTQGLGTQSAPVIQSAIQKKDDDLDF